MAENNLEYTVNVEQCVLATVLTLDKKSYLRAYGMEVAPINYYFSKSIFHPRDLMEKFQQLIAQNPLANTENLILRLEEGCETILEKSSALSSKYNGGNPDLKSLFVEFCQYNRQFMPLLPLPIVLERFITKRLEKLLGKNFTYIGDLASPDKPSEMNKSEKKILELSIAYRKGDDIEGDVRKFVEEFGYLNTHFFLKEPYSFDEMMKKIIAESKDSPQEKLDKIESNARETQARYREAITRIKPNEELQQWIDFAREDVHLRTYRLDCLNKSFCIVRPMFLEIAEKFGIPIGELLSASPDEINRWFDGENPDRQVLQSRMINYGAFPDEDSAVGYKVVDKEEAEEMLGGLKEKNESDEIKGFPAQGGKAKGKVHKIMDKKEIMNFQDGEVLVTPMTTPDFIHAFKKAVAVVTDIGGITSHAAITSRELKVPCIIGTKNATQLLHDGDMVEVDADNGTVRKI